MCWAMTRIYTECGHDRPTLVICAWFYNPPTRNRQRRDVLCPVIPAGEITVDQQLCNRCLRQQFNLVHAELTRPSPRRFRDPIIRHDLMLRLDQLAAECERRRRMGESILSEPQPRTDVVNAAVALDALLSEWILVVGVLLLLFALLCFALLHV